MNGRCENHHLDRAINVCDSCYGEFCDDCLTQPKSRRLPWCTDCALVASGVRSRAQLQLRGERRTAKKRRRALAEQRSSPTGFDFFDIDSPDRKGREADERASEPTTTTTDKAGQAAEQRDDDGIADGLLRAIQPATDALRQHGSDEPAEEPAASSDSGSSTPEVDPHVEMDGPFDRVPMTPAVARLQELKRQAEEQEAAERGDLPGHDLVRRQTGARTTGNYNLGRRADEPLAPASNVSDVRPTAEPAPTPVVDTPPMPPAADPVADAPPTPPAADPIPSPVAETPPAADPVADAPPAPPTAEPVADPIPVAQADPGPAEDLVAALEDPTSEFPAPVVEPPTTTPAPRTASTLFPQAGAPTGAAGDAGHEGDDDTPPDVPDVTATGGGRRRSGDGSDSIDRRRRKSDGAETTTPLTAPMIGEIRTIGGRRLGDDGTVATMEPHTASTGLTVDADDLNGVEQFDAGLTPARRSVDGETGDQPAGAPGPGASGPGTDDTTGRPGGPGRPGAGPR